LLGASFGCFRLEKVAVVKVELAIMVIMAMEHFINLMGLQSNSLYLP
jgi:hypothetical protein